MQCFVYDEDVQIRMKYIDGEPWFRKTGTYQHTPPAPTLQDDASKLAFYMYNNPAYIQMLCKERLIAMIEAEGAPLGVRTKGLTVLF